MPRRLSARYSSKPELVQIATLDGTILEVMIGFKYLGSMTSSTKVDVKFRKAAAWRTCNTFNRLWKSQLNRSRSEFLYSC